MCCRATCDLRLGNDTLDIRNGQSRMPQAYEVTLACLASTTRPDAIFALNSLMTAAAFRAIHDKGLKCPADVVLVGFDNFGPADAFTPLHTTVEQYPLMMETKAVEESAHIIDTGAPSHPQTVTPATLIARALSLCAPRAGRDIR